MKLSVDQYKVLRAASRGYTLKAAGGSAWIEKGDDTEMIDFALLRQLKILGLMTAQFGEVTVWALTEKGKACIQSRKN